MPVFDYFKRTGEGCRSSTDCNTGTFRKFTLKETWSLSHTSVLLHLMQLINLLKEDFQHYVTIPEPVANA